MNAPDHYPRHLRPRLEEALADPPVVLVHGPRRYGKTTLAREVGDELGIANFKAGSPCPLKTHRKGG